MKTTTITLAEPIEGHGDDKIRRIVLREPKFGDIMTLGEPVAYAQSQGGLVYQAERDGIVEGYVRRLLVEPNDPQLLAQCGLVDTLKFKEAIFDFFRAAREASSS